MLAWANALDVRPARGLAAGSGLWRCGTPQPPRGTETQPFATVDLAAATSPLVGRARECATIDGLLEAAAGGQGGALVIRGESGIGKSALLRYAVSSADGMEVLAIAGVEAEADLPFAGLFGLVRPILGHLDALQEPQAAALAGALGLAPSAGVERFLVSAAVLGLLAEAADERPVLCIIDDAQWIDTPSADALVFAARRLRAERVALVFAARDGDGRSFEGHGLPEITPAGLDHDDALALLDQRPAEVAPAVRERLVTEAAGNPLALLELPGALSEPQLAGLEMLPDAIPLTARLRTAFAARLGSLPEPTRAIVLAAALDDTGDAATALRAAAALGVPPDALDPAEATGLVHTTDGTIAFRHPLVRAAAIGGATLAQRQRTHAAVASALEGDEHADRRVWHEALATLTADEDVAAALDAAARRSELRGGHASAATAFERAAELTEAGAARARRLGSAAGAAWTAGQVPRARTLAERALALAEAPQRPRLLYLSGVIEGRSGSLPHAIGILQEASEQTDDRALMLEILREACEFAGYAADHERLTALCDRLAEVPPTTDAERFTVAAFGAIGAAMVGDHALGAELAAEAVVLAEGLDDPRLLIVASITAGRETLWGAGLSHADAAVEIARRRGLLSTLPYALQAQAAQLLGQGRFDVAYAAAEEGRQLALDIGQPWAASWNLASLALVDAVRGDEDPARAHLEELQGFVAASGAKLVLGHIGRILGLLHLSLGRPGEALDSLRIPIGMAKPKSSPLVCLGIADAVEAAAGSGRLDEVADHLASYRAWVERFPNPARRALLARCEALAADGDDAERHFSQATRLGHHLYPFDRARTELLYGEWLRRHRRRTEARTHLRAALTLFEPLNVPPWTDRARAELRATGETAHKRSDLTLDELTPQELRIARLVADGMTNRDIAGRLFLSPRTIDYHLRKVFSKLQIASRTDLVRMGLAEHEVA